MDYGIADIGEEKEKLKLDKASLKMIENTPKIDGKYRVICKEITHIAEHDLDQTKTWCHTQRTSMFYWTQLSLRLLNNNSTSIITNENYTEQNRERATEHQLRNFDLDQVEGSYRQAFDSDHRRKIDN